MGRGMSGFKLKAVFENVVKLMASKKGESPLPFTDLPKSLATLFD